MVRRFWWVPALLVLTASGGSGAPVAGPHAMARVRIGAQGKMEFEQKFEGGRRACVIARGDHKPVVDVGVAVYDEAGRLIAEDKAGGDYVAAIWYPARAAKYKIEVHNSGIEYNDMYLVFK